MSERAIRRIMQQVAEVYGVSVRDLTGASKKAQHVRPREVAMYLARQTTGASLARIGRVCGGKHHTSVLAAVRRVEAELRIGNESLSREVGRLREKVTATGLAAEEEGLTSKAVRKALRRLRELASIAEEIAAECRRLEGQLSRFAKESRAAGNDSLRQESRPAYVHSGAADGRPGRPSTRDLPGRCT